jgi:hypothetical protein
VICSHQRTSAGKYLFPQTQQGFQIVQPSARTQNDGPRMLAQTLPEQDNQPTIIDGPEKSRNISTSASFRPYGTIPPSRPAFLDRHVSQFGWSAVSPSRPALSQSAACSGRQGKRTAARSHAQPPLRGEHGEHGEHWTSMATARGATLDQAEGVRTSASASHNPYRAREAEAGSPSKSVTATPSISVILLKTIRAEERARTE